MQDSGLFTDSGHDPFYAAVEAFGAGLQAAWPSPEAEEGVREAYARYAEVLEGALQAPDVAERAAEHFAEYERKVAEAFADEGAREQVAEAFAGFAEELKRAWAEVDPNTLTPWELSALAQQLSWAAGVAGVVERLTAP